MIELKVRPLDAEGKERVQAVLDRAVTDIGFRNQLLADPSGALEGVDLSQDELTMLTTMRRVALEEWGVDVRRFRSFLRDNGNKVTASA